METPNAPLVFLVGFMGSGKTTIGRALAGSLGWPLLDIDELIVAREGRPIPEVFRLRGEPYFRQVEGEILFTFGERRPAVVALGGGTFCRPENQAYIRRHGVSVWLQCSLEEILRRLPDDGSRPLFRDPAQVAELLAARTPYYEVADGRVNVTGRRVDAIVGDILAWLRGRWPVPVRLA